MSVGARKRGSSIWSSVLDRISEGRRLRIFIIPTWYCILFNVLVLIIMGYGFSNRSVSIISTGFLIIFIEILSMIESHVNVRDLRLDIIPGPPVVENGVGRMTIKIQSQSQSFGLCCYVVDNNQASRFLIFREQGSLRPYAIREFSAALAFWNQKRTNEDVDEFNCGPTSELKSLTFAAKERGVHKVPTIVICSMFPFGMFRVWREFNSEHSYAAYPRPNGVEYKYRDAAYQNAQASAFVASGLRYAETEYAKHQEFTAGDSLRRIDWKASSRRGVKIVKVFTSEGSKATRVIGWNETKHLVVGKRLEQLTKWILDAEDDRVSYRLELPTLTSPFGSGDRHKSHCLKMLALFAQSLSTGPEVT